MNDPSVNLDLAIEHGLSSEEFDLIHSILKELQHLLNWEYSLLCGEHCSIKFNKNVKNTTKIWG